MKFTFKMENEDTGDIVETSCSAMNHLYVIKKFQDFLSGCGFKFTVDEEILIWDHSLEPMKDLGE